MLKRLVLVGVMTAFGVGGLATPALATTGTSGTVCDSATNLGPSDGCTRFQFLVPLLSSDEYVAVATGYCAGPGQDIPTLDIECLYAEVDVPSVP